MDPTKQPKPNGTTLSLLALGLLATTLVGCAGSAVVRGGAVYGDPVVYVDTVPGYVYSQPAVYYRGYPAYYVDNRWYYQSPSGWVVFRREPAALYQRRVHVSTRVHAAPRIHRPARVHAVPRARVPHQRGQSRGRAHGHSRGHSNRR